MRGLIFDFDGLILDTEVPIFRAWQECYEAHGEELSLKEYARCVGTDMQHYHPGEELDRRVGGELDAEEWEIKRRDRVRELLEDAEPMPGVRRVLIEAEALGLPCAVASSSPAEWVTGWLDRLGIAGAFASVRCIDHVHRPKPDPALFLRAAEDLRVGPGEAVVLEDSLNGLRAARAAGSPCVVVPNAITSHLNFEEATVRLETLGGVSLRELVAEVVARAVRW
ncbi:MAG: HAD-IA family hydrolase [Verrucomicrobiota bacterium]